MKSRIPMLVSAGFALIIALGLATRLFLDFEFQHAVRRGQAIDTGSLQLRASVRSLRADCLDMGQTVSARLLTAADDPAVRLRLADLNRRFDEYLIRAIAAPCSEELRSILRTIQTRDRALIKSAQDQVLVLAGTDPDRATEWYLTRYMEAQTGTMRHLDRALQLASAETANLSDRWAADARRSERWAQLAIALFLVLGVAGAVFLVRVVAGLTQRVEDAGRTNPVPRTRCSARSGHSEPCVRTGSRIVSKISGGRGKLLKLPLSSKCSNVRPGVSPGRWTHSLPLLRKEMT